MAQIKKPKETFTLYHHRQSICSLMVRYMFAISGPSTSGDSDMILELHEVDIFKNAHLEEHFLCDVNPKGQVPVLASPGILSTPIRDSLDITFYACERFPSLRPPEHVTLINRLLRDLHAINFFSLSFNTRPSLATTFKNGVLERLARPDISSRYRAALEYKLTVIESEKVDGLLPETVAAEVERARAFLVEVEGLIEARLQSKGNERQSIWIFGGDAPTALDASLIVFLVRMRDVGRSGLIPTRLSCYTDIVAATPEFVNVYAAL
ncbi:hypothetical protein F5884DRAFT_546689 [Xylogone sp. PMI_703]|nr:hypothetical protein F5884DRAFT_546689 [Xylogone sp. PMI_703]